MEKAEDLLVFPTSYSEVSCHLMLANAMEREASCEASPRKAFSLLQEREFHYRKRGFHYHTFVHHLLQFYMALQQPSSDNEVKS